MRNGNAGRAALLLVCLGACQPTGAGGPFGKLLGNAPGAKTDTVAAGVGEVEQIDVEAPEVYSLSAQGLWDGRPSLGGVWVAHPEVKSPERVVIRTAGGRSVNGALFRRERQSAGPAFQLSSEAATALGIPPGTAADLQVVALRTEARVTAPPPPSDADPAAPATDAPGAAVAAGTVTATPLDPAVTAAVAATATTAPLAPSAITAPKPPAPKPPSDATVVAPGAIDAPYVQVGFFAEEEGAEAAAARLKAAGIETRVALAESGTRRLWRVVAGPAETAAARDDLITAIRAQGYDRPVPVGN